MFEPLDEIVTVASWRLPRYLSTADLLTRRLSRDDNPTPPVTCIRPRERQNCAFWEQNTLCTYPVPHHSARLPVPPSGTSPPLLAEPTPLDVSVTTKNFGNN